MRSPVRNLQARLTSSLRWQRELSMPREDYELARYLALQRRWSRQQKRDVIHWTNASLTGWRLLTLTGDTHQHSSERSTAWEAVMCAIGCCTIGEAEASLPTDVVRFKNAHCSAFNGETQLAKVVSPLSARSASITNPLDRPKPIVAA